MQVEQSGSTTTRREPSSSTQPMVTINTTPRLTSPQPDQQGVVSHSHSISAQGTFIGLTPHSPSANYQGKMTLYLKWMPNNGNMALDPVPPRVGVLLYSAAAIGVDPNAGGSASAANGLGHPGPPTPYPVFEGSNPQPVSQGLRSQSRGYLLVQRALSGAERDAGEITLDPYTVTLSGSALSTTTWRSYTFSIPVPPFSQTYSHPWTYPGRIGGGMNFSAKIDYRDLLISSSIEPSTKKGPGDEPVPNVRNADGSMTVDSAATWDERRRRWYGSAIFQPQASGPWNISSGSPLYPHGGTPICSWSHAGGDFSTFNALPEDQYGATYFTAATAAYGISLGGQSNGTGMTRSTQVTLKGTDRLDGLSLENKYTVNWHLPVEWESNPYDQKRLWHSVPPLGPVTESEEGTPNGSLSATFQYEQFYLGAISTAGQAAFTAGSVLAATAAGAPGIAVALLYSTAGISLQQHAQPQVTTHDCIFSAAWEMNTSADTRLPNFTDYPTFEGGRPQNADGSNDNSLTARARFKLTNLRLAVGYRDDYYKGDAYGPSGYTGIERNILRRLESRITVANFEKVNPDPPAPPGPMEGQQ